MELPQNLDLKLLVLQKLKEQIILETTNIFFFLLKNPKILLKNLTLKLSFHRTNVFLSFDPI